ncbi:NAD-dependent epimerase/dehydratase family protein [Peribacillus butanolivorans]|uniref:NAD-dependent epimerase/dehydratase family protein n=1 Tax=Peribacillus butanolivorans TaxID=421767 RepID=UPI0036634615
MIKKVIITGANGFLGSALTNFLAKKGVKIFAIVRNEHSNIERLNNDENIEVIYCNLSEITKLEQLIPDRDIDVFYHLAWSGASGHERANYKTQLQNVAHSLECANQAMVLNCKKFISIGTIGEFMATLALKNNIVSENFTYAISKHFYHSLLDIFCYKNDIQYTWCTLSGVYGSGDNTSNLINYTIQTLLSKQEPEYTKAEQLFDFIYVEDCVRCLFEIGKRENTEKYYYIGGICPKPLREFVEEIRDTVSPNSTLGFGKRPEDGTVYKKEWFTMNKTMQLLNFQHNYTFEQGVKKTFEWIKSKGQNN